MLSHGTLSTAPSGQYGCPPLRHYVPVYVKLGFLNRKASLSQCFRFVINALPCGALPHGTLTRPLYVCTV